VKLLGGVVERSTTGVRIAKDATNLVNNITLVGTKLVLNGSTTQTDGIGLYAYTQVEGLVLDGVHVESYNNGIKLDGIRSFVINGCNVSGFASGTTPIGIRLDNACEHGFIGYNRFSNNSSAGTGIQADATAHSGIVFMPNRFSNIADEIADSTTTAANHNLMFTPSESGGLRVKTTQITLGRAVDETMTLTFDRASSDAYVRWSEADSRIEASTNLYSGGHITSVGRVDVGTFLRLPVSTTLTIASGAVTATLSNHKIDTEAAAGTDDLDTINGGGADGQILVIRAADSARTVSVTEAGNIKLTATPFALDNAEDTLTLMYNGSAWLELSRSDNGA
jgi:hypothetical protein